MGKKVKNKARAPQPQKNKWIAAESPKKVPQTSDPDLKIHDDVVSVAKERRPCPHIDKGVDLNSLSAKIVSSELVRCEDCRESAADRRGGKGKGKHGKKKGSASESRAIWVCLQCGHYSCGGVGLPTTPQSHALRHSRQTRHMLVMHFENPQLRWCFACSMLIASDKMEENGEQKDIFSDVVKLIKGHSSNESSTNIEEVLFGSGSVISDIKSAGSTLTDLDGRGDYTVRGLVNLGNTCFFNSVLQNLLAIDRFRGYFLDLDSSAGPLAISLKKLVTETRPEAGVKIMINPRSFFGSLCSKAPQFRGYQQQDSHELLRFLLDGLCTEELSMRKRISSSKENGMSLNAGPTFVDATFGGQISSSVRCVECGHSSTVYESFLDLSLPIPSKRPPPKTAQPISRAKKTKLPPKRSGKVRSKITKDKNYVPSPSVATPSTSSGLANQPQSSSTDSNVAGQGDVVMKSLSAVQEFKNEQVFEDSAEQTSTLLDNSTNEQVFEDSEKDSAERTSTLLDNSTNEQVFVDSEKDSAEQTSTLLDNSTIEIVFEDSAEQTSTLLDDSTWLDYLDMGNMSDDNDVPSQNNGNSIIQDSENKNTTLNDVSLQSGSDSSNQVPISYIKPDFSSVNAWEEEVPVQVQGSEVLLLPYKEESSITGEIMAGEGEASSSMVGEQNDFDGFGDLFNEPEVVEGPAPRPSVGEGSTATGFGASESDPDEVDDTVSVESCLAHFMKPELLANENAWDCENCSKTLQRQRLEAKKQVKVTANIFINGCETRAQSDSLSSNKGPCPADVRNLSNGNVKNNISCNQLGEKMVLGDGKVNPIENDGSDKSNSILCQQQEGNSELKDAVPVQPNTLDCNRPCSVDSFSNQAIDHCADEPKGAGFSSENVPHTSSGILNGNHKSEESEDEGKNSKRSNVKRDATKRVLISRAPPILTIHLKRFTQDARGRLSKLTGHVNFREKIDLRPYMDSRFGEGEKYEYRLIGAVEHSGTMRGGHYIAYVRGGKRSTGNAEKENAGHVWYYASDAHVRQATLDEVLRCDAYILFYEKS